MKDWIASGASPMTDKNCKDTVWLTPSWLVEIASRIVGGIDLDPATEPSNPTGARRFFTEADNGLERSWKCQAGGIFVNPPYGRAIKSWVQKIGAEARCQDTPMVALLPGQRFEQHYWMRSLFQADMILVALRSRICFEKPDGSKLKGNPFGSFLYCYNVSFQCVTAAVGEAGMVLQVGALRVPDEKWRQPRKPRVNREPEVYPI